MESSDPLNPIWEGPETTFYALRGAISEQEADSGGEPYFWLQLALSQVQQEVEPIEFGRILISLKRLGFESDLLENFRNSNFDISEQIKDENFSEVLRSNWLEAIKHVNFDAVRPAAEEQGDTGRGDIAIDELKIYLRGDRVETLGPDRREHLFSASDAGSTSLRDLTSRAELNIGGRFPVVIEADDYGAYRISLEVPGPDDITQADWENARTNVTAFGYRVPFVRYGRDYILGPITRENEFSYRVFAALGERGQLTNESRFKGTISVSVPYEEGLAEIIVKAGKKNQENITWS